MRFVLFPYEKIKPESKIIIYGMGYLGQMFAKQISQNHYCEIMFGLDCKAENIECNDICIYNPDKVNFATIDKCDYFVIALLDATSAAEIKEHYLQLGVKREKIVCGYKVMHLQDDVDISAGIERCTRIAEQCSSSINETQRKLSDIEGKLRGMQWYMANRTGRILFGLDSYIQNEFLMKHYPEKVCDMPRMRKFHTLLNHLRVYDISTKHRFIRIGREQDGGYVMLDNYPRGGDMYLYGFGVGDDISFEEQMAGMGYEVYLYDHTVKGLVRQHDRIHFFKRGLTGVATADKPELSTLPDLLQSNGHTDKNGMILKMDIEGAEIDVFNHLPDNFQSRFSQIVMEIHNLENESAWDGLIEMLAKINHTHRLVHLHANNYSKVLYLGDTMLSGCVEATFVKKDDFIFQEKHGFLHMDMDAKNAHERMEVPLWQI